MISPSIFEAISASYDWSMHSGVLARRQSGALDHLNAQSPLLTMSCTRDCRTSTFRTHGMLKYHLKKKLEKARCDFREAAQ